MPNTDIAKSVVPNADGTTTEIRFFNDERIQAAVDGVIRKAQAMGKNNGVFFTVNIRGEAKLGVSVRLGDHWSFGGFLETDKTLQLDGAAQIGFAF